MEWVIPFENWIYANIKLAIAVHQLSNGLIPLIFRFKTAIHLYLFLVRNKHSEDNTEVNLLPSWMQALITIQEDDPEAPPHILVFLISSPQ